MKKKKHVDLIMIKCKSVRRRKISVYNMKRRNKKYKHNIIINYVIICFWGK